MIKLSTFIRCLAKYRLKLSDKQKVMIHKLYRVNYVSNPDVVSISNIFDMEI